MVLKVLTNGLGGDLNNAPDNFGLDNDLITVASQAIAYDYIIQTLAGADLIDLRVTNAGNTHSVSSGAGRDTVQGGAGQERIRDQSGNDLFILRGGNDYCYSGKGNDTIDGGAGLDGISFLNLYNNAGIAAVNSSGITCDLAKTDVQDFGIFGKDRIKGFESVDGGAGADRLFGTGGANVMYANDGNDLLVGRGGADDLYGGRGNDRLTGSAGADYLNSGEGKDRLTGGAGADEFDISEDIVAERDTIIYTRISDSGNGLSPATIDVITFFDQGGLATDDKIDLSAIDASPNQAGNQAFLFRGTGNFTSPRGEVRLVKGEVDTLVMVDIDGDGKSEMNILLDGVTGLTAGDFFL